MSDAPTSACADCAGRCCCVYIVPVTGFDIWRIAQEQRLPPSVFVQHDAEDKPSDTGFVLRARGQTYGLALQHHKTRQERICVFLLALRDGIKRCGIYAQRPTACRTYPMEFHHGLAVTRSDKLCPQHAWSELNDQQEQWRARLSQQDDEWQTYARVVRHWNAHVHSHGAEHRFAFDHYLAYLLNAYDLLDTQHFGQPATAIDRPLAALAASYSPQ